MEEVFYQRNFPHWDVDWSLLVNLPQEQFLLLLPARTELSTEKFNPACDRRCAFTGV